jgi:hypothetical protein
VPHPFTPGWSALSLPYGDDIGVQRSVIFARRISAAVREGDWDAVDVLLAGPAGDLLVPVVRHDSFDDLIMVFLIWRSSTRTRLWFCPGRVLLMQMPR